MIVLGLVAVLILGLGLWVHNLDKNPEISVPTPAMPARNAYDYYKAAGDALVDEHKIGFALSPHTSGGGYPGGRQDPADHIYSLAEKAALVNENEGAIQMLHQGFRFPYQEPAWSFSTQFTDYAKFRGLARLLSVKAEVDAEQGDWGGAMTAGIDAVHLGETMPRGGPILGTYTGAECQAIGRRPAWQAVDHLNAIQAREAARRLEQVRASHIPFAEILQPEKWRTQANLLELMRQRNWPGNWQAMLDNGLPDGGQSTPTWERWQTGMRIRLIGKRRIMANFTQYTDQIIANVRQPYAAQLIPPPLPADPVNHTLLPDFGRARFREVKTDTQNALLLTALALRAYKLDHGAYPSTLATLVPSYLQAIPDDPFALSGPIHYKRLGMKYLLYSVGPDGKDDGGTVIFHKNRPAPRGPGDVDQQHWVETDSRGDIVARVNP